MRLISLSFVSLLAVSVPTASAATLRVCATGCAYTVLQPAIDAAVPGDTILLRAGETFVGPFILRAKPASTSWITIRSDASDSLLPASGVRLVPSGKPGANTSRSLLPRLVGQGGALKTTPVIRTAAGAHHYRLQFLEVDGAANMGFETLITLGGDGTAAPAHDLVIDRVYAHGDFYRGMKRGITLNGERTDILNSYISDIKAVNADSQAIAGYNGKGPFRIINNYLEGAGENVLFGGSDPAVTDLVPSDIEVRGNHMFKPLAWRHAILGAPASPTATAATSGSLAAGIHYFTIVAMMDTDNRTAVSVPSLEVSATVSASGAASLTWIAVGGADRYRIYRGRSAGGESTHMTTGSAATTFKYTGAPESAGTPAASGTQWTVKNIFELKNAQRVLVDGNVMENIWQAGQYGYALVLTPRNQYGGASWVRVRDVTISNNIVRHASGVMQVSGYDATHPSQQTQRVTLRNNLFYDIDPKKWGGGAKAYLIGEGPAGIVLDRNTLIHANTSVVYVYGTQDITGFVYTNNISVHGSYGIMGEGGRAGQYSIDAYLPSSTITNNVLAGGSASAYPTPNAFPTLTQWAASFVDLAGGDYRLLPTSVFYAAGAAGSIPGADLDRVYAAVNAGTITAPAPSGTTTEPPPTTNAYPMARPGGPYAGATGVAVTVDGSGSFDSDGSIARHRWTWGDEIVVNAADVPASAIVGSRWVRTQVSGAAGGWALYNPNANASKVGSAAAAPASYVDVRFYAAAGVPYQLWFRMRAEADSYANDSMFVQFSGSVDAQGNAVKRIGTTGAGIIILEEGSGAGVSGWGWNDEGYGSLADPVYFATTGVQTLRVQQREDGMIWDQVVLSAATYANASPGETRADTTTVTQSEETTAVASHAYGVAGTYPVVLLVTDNDGASATASTTVAIGGGSASLGANAGGPYAGAVGQAVTFDASRVSVPSGSTPQYQWTFGDDIVLDASLLTPVGTRWRSVADSTAAGDVAIENPDLGQSKLPQAQVSPASYVEGSFQAASGVPYRLWIRMRAGADAYANDSIYVQFSGTVTSSGAATGRIGSTSALAIVLEDGSSAGVQGWGWADAGYGTLGSPIYFNQDGLQTIRIQQREDGARIDQIVISAGDHAASAPGSTTADATVVPVFGPGASGATVTHTYSAPGTFPVTLTVRAGSSASTASTTAVIR